jgi:ribose 5-phosphate isomerase B
MRERYYEIPNVALSKKMRIAIGADHGGYPLNERVIEELRGAGHELIDFGTHDGSVPDDYPDYAVKICGSGVGAAVAANKLRGIRAALCGDTYSGHQSREHDDCNVLCLGARVIGVELALEIVRAFVAARFTGEERHRRRLAKVAALENHEL